MCCTAPGKLCVASPLGDYMCCIIVYVAPPLATYLATCPTHLPTLPTYSIPTCLLYLPTVPAYLPTYPTYLPTTYLLYLPTLVPTYSTYLPTHLATYSIPTYLLYLPILFYTPTYQPIPLYAHVMYVVYVCVCVPSCSVCSYVLLVICLRWTALFMALVVE